MILTIFPKVISYQYHRRSYHRIVNASKQKLFAAYAPHSGERHAYLCAAQIAWQP